MNKLSDQKIGLSHISITCPSKEGVASHITVLRTYVQLQGTQIDTNRYKSTVLCVKW
jgi:hypothetical protein